MAETPAGTKQFDWTAMASLVGFLAALTSSILVALHQAWLERHPYWVIALYLSTMAAFVLLVWRFFAARQPHVPAPAETSNKATASGSSSDAVSQTVGGDNSGRLVAKVEHYHEASPAVSTPPAAKTRTPNLAAKHPKKAYLNTNCRTPALVDGPNEGPLTLILPIENLAPDEHHGTAVEGRHLVASLKFSKEGNELANISTAYWLGKQENWVTLPVASSEIVVVGSYKTGQWSCYQNDRRDPFPKRLTMNRLRNLAFADCVPLEPKHVYLNAYIDVEIKVLSVGTEATTMLLKKLYRLSVDKDPNDFVVQELS